MQNLDRNTTNQYHRKNIRKYSVRTMALVQGARVVKISLEDRDSRDLRLCINLNLKMDDSRICILPMPSREGIRVLDCVSILSLS